MKTIKNRCTNCGYEFDYDGKCPECGSDLVTTLPTACDSGMEEIKGIVFVTEEHRDRLQSIKDLKPSDFDGAIGFISCTDTKR